MNYDRFASVVRMRSGKDRRQAKTSSDLVNHPPHYKTGGIETIDFIRAKLGRDGFITYCRGNALKYLSRLGDKGDPAQAARKAEWYTARLAETLESISED